MSVKKFDLFIPIVKVDEQQRLVYGCLAQEELDNSGEIFDYDSSKPNFEKWSEDQFTASGGLSKGNVRAMHTSIAAGKLTDMSFDDAAKKIEGCAKVVDDNEWQKVLEGVYTGFSMGGRYEKRWQDNGQTRYTAIPVEMSLVDKPCIKSAVFGGMVKHDSFLLIKADGSEEQRLFKGAEDMYVPTNDEILPVAQALAKAAGKTDADWLDYVQPATDQIVLEKGGNPFGKDQDKGEDAGDDGDKDKNTDKDKKKTPSDKKEDQVDAGDDGDKDKNKAKKADVAAPADHADTDCPVQNCDKCAGMAAKSDVAAPEQVWKAADGTTFAKKAECITHNEKLAKGENLSLVEELQKAAADVAALASGEAVEETAETVVVDEEPLDVRAEKFVKFLSDPEVIEKSIYNVSRTADSLASLSSLYLAVKSESGAEGSTVAASIMTAVEALGKALVDAATEEVGEMMDRLKTTDEDDAVIVCYPDYYCELAASSFGLEKASVNEFFAKAISVSSQDKARLQKIHDHSAALGAKCPDPASKEVSDDDAGDETAKMAKAAGFDTPMEYLRDTLAKRDKELEELTPLVKSLSADVQRLMAMPRAAAARTHVIGKSDEAGAGGDDTPLAKAMKALEGLPPEELAKAAFKLAQQNGRHITTQS